VNGRSTQPRAAALALRMATSGVAAVVLLIAMAFPLGWLKSVRVSSINMVPTLVPDDRVVVLSYGENAARGDVVVYRSPLGDSLLVARIVAIAGETVELREDGLVLDGCPVTVEAAATDGKPPQQPYEENGDEAGTCGIGSEDCSAAHAACRTPSCSGDARASASGDAALKRRDAGELVATEAVGQHCYYTRKAGPIASLLFDRRSVPAGHVFVLNDNRVDERDSRVYGAIPLEAVVGVASFVYYASGESGIRWDRMTRRVS